MRNLHVFPPGSPSKIQEAVSPDTVTEETPEENFDAAVYCISYPSRPVSFLHLSTALPEAKEDPPEITGLAGVTVSTILLLTEL